MDLAWVADNSEIANGYIDGEVKTPFPPRPSAIHSWDWVGKEWIDPSLDALQAEKLEEIDRIFEDRASALTAGYPSAERLTWPVQQAEALAWAENDAAATPFLDGLAQARGIDRMAMRSKAVDVVRAFMQASQQLVGVRQRLRDAVLMAETPEQIAAVMWPN